ncbi:E3 ubiquitin-protein ligase Topors-like protein [Amazona aestiva]|uniref:RING-type E3 ubiquitin transferase n=1 Tax=Amazona aestiva TaxID=12930 RepID=A0A0Q3LT87_AMAAE|nr:E3 ubiquitin-protein ligase Topors-like protein [Amazona aestiva]
MASGAEKDSDSATAADTKLAQQENAANSLCPICLDPIDDTAYTDPCFHTFCFHCIKQWADMAATCPLCRWPIKTILHMVRSDEED